MINPKFELNISPDKYDFSKVEKWLSDEYESSNEGFYCQWPLINECYNRNELVTIDLNGEPVGFIVWKKNDITAEIGIFEIKPDLRRKGLGKLFYNQFSEFLKLQKILVTKLHCSPLESEKFWKKLGFIKFPNRGYSEPELTYYKPLIDVLTPSIENKESEYKIELWDVKAYKAECYLPKWTWYLELSEGCLKKPIIQPCNREWKLKWSKNGVVIKEGQIRHLNINEKGIEFTPFLYISQLIE